MTTKERDIVDAETKLAIDEGNQKVIAEIKKDFKDFSAEIKEYIDLKYSPVEKGFDRLRLDVDDLYNKDREMRDRVSALEQRQSLDEGNRTGRDQEKDTGFKGREIFIGVVGAVIAICGILFGIFKG